MKTEKEKKKDFSDGLGVSGTRYAPHSAAVYIIPENEESIRWGRDETRPT